MLFDLDSQKSSLRVCIDAHMVGARETGNETYVVCLAHALSKIPGVTVIAALEKGTKIPVLWQDTSIEIAYLSSSNNFIRLLSSLPKVCEEYNADILHVTYNIPFYSKIPVVVSVHDTIYKIYPEFFSFRDKLLFATLLRMSIYRSDAIVTISQTSKNDIVKNYPFVNNKVFPILIAAHSVFQYVESQEKRIEIRDKYNISSKYILAVGNLQPRKNLRRLVAAFRQLLSNGVTDYQLVLVGKGALGSVQFQNEIEDLIDSKHIILTGYVPDDDLSSLYSDAALFVYPSIYEGFGLPILEAMNCGTPVITSSTSAMPEVAGDAAILVDPLNVDSISHAMYLVLTQPQLASKLSAKSRERASRFTWKAAGENTTN
jgi:glycosyltransferase involved in cell wall biosynthesis